MADLKKKISTLRSPQSTDLLPASKLLRLRSNYGIGPLKQTVKDAAFLISLPAAQPTFVFRVLPTMLSQFDDSSFITKRPARLVRVRPTNNTLPNTQSSKVSDQMRPSLANAVS